ncbi:hypothetical protein HMI55_007258 [Coelomomyces lativittatus]|nr:hypothetical protein HMI55_007258 [Coelomomyces lativittatus]
MGAYAPASSMALVQRVYQTVLLPTVHGLRKEGCPFVGVLYAGLMVSPNLHSFHVLEFNVRFGDPETQVLMPLVHGDLLPAFWASCHGFLDAVNVSFRPSTYACTVVLASKGYPSTTSSNPLPIHLPPQKSNDTTPLHEQEGSLLVFHASTQWTQDDQCMTLPGAGRVMCITTSGPSLEQARTRIYQALKDTREVHFEGMHYRQDIGQRTLEATPLPMSLSSPTKTPTSMGTTYQDAGVSMDQGDELVRRIQPLVKATKRPGANADLGGFGGCFDLGQAGFSATDVLVAATDGVGTKLKLAFAMNRHDTIGIDLVAMNVNDIVVQGAQPLFFLDYFGCGHLDVTVAFQVIQGIVMGCQEAGCALIGGETAEMPSMYPPNEYDVAGFCVGAVSPSALLPKPDTMQALDCVLGWVSSGLHSNGFSLVRHVVHPLDLHAPCPFDPTRSLGDVLLTPTRIYVKDCLKIASLVKGMAHITGGGLLENIPRILPSHLKVTLNAQQWPSLPIFRFLQDLGQIEPKEMLRTFNCGLGMVVIASPEHVAQLQSLVPEILVVGVVHARASADEPQVEVENFN